MTGCVLGLWRILRHKAKHNLLLFQGSEKVHRTSPVEFIRILNKILFLKKQKLHKK